MVFSQNCRFLYISLSNGCLLILKMNEDFEQKHCLTLDEEVRQIAVWSDRILVAANNRLIMLTDFVQETAFSFDEMIRNIVKWRDSVVCIFEHSIKIISYDLDGDI